MEEKSLNDIFTSDGVGVNVSIDAKDALMVALAVFVGMVLALVVTEAIKTI